MDEEFYIEETNNKRKYITLTLVMLCLIGIGFFLYKKYLFDPKTLVVYEVGDTYKDDVSEYVNNTIINKDRYKLIVDDHFKVEDGKVTKAGKYTFTIRHNSKDTKVAVEVKDTKAPEVELQNLIVGLDEEYEPDEFIAVCNEYSKPCTASFKKESDAELYKKEGTYKVSLIVKDLYDNSVTKEANLTVKKGYSLANEKKKDLTPVRLSQDYGDWDKKTYVVTYVSAIDPVEVTKNDRYRYLYEMAEDNLSNYLPSGYEGLTVTDGEIIYVYNRYNYVVGFLYRATLSDGRTVYLTNGE